MLIYSITLIISVFFAYMFSHCVYKGNEIPRWIAIIVTAIPTILVTGFRYQVGTDYGMYRFAFLNPDNINVKHNFEILNRLYFKLVAYLGGSFYVSVLISSAIFFIFTYIEIYHDSPKPWLSTFLLFGLLFFFIYMNVERQMVAISILMFSLRFLEKRKYFPFLLCVVIASLIHKSSIIFILVLLLFQINISYGVIFGLTPVIFIFSAFFGRISNFLANIFNYESYVNTSGFNFGSRFIIGFTWQIVLTILGCYAYSGNNSKEDQDKYRLFFNIQVLTLWTYAFSGAFAGNEIARIRYMFAMPSIIFTPMIIKRIPNKVIKFVFVLATIIYGIMNIYFVIYLNNEQQTLPYQTIFSVGDL